MASKKKTQKNGKCHSGYNFSDEIRYDSNKLKSYNLRERNEVSAGKDTIVRIDIDEIRDIISRKTFFNKLNLNDIDFYENGKKTRNTP